MLKKLVSKSAKTMKKLIENNQSNETMFVKEMDMKINHYLVFVVNDRSKVINLSKFKENR